MNLGVKPCRLQVGKSRAAIGLINRKKPYRPVSGAVSVA